ncbi:carbohydrate-binding module family 13 protein [Rhodotorula sp. JG-1b]|nr:carbohydrate-binding module family 13 protein [Rhodotorula sp. JG-1b]
MKTPLLFSLALAALWGAIEHSQAAIVDPYKLPHKSEPGQYGYNDCGKHGDSPSAKCQTLYAPPKKATIGDSESYEVSWCTKAGHGARLIPAGALKSAHFIKTDRYIQITGTGDFTKMKIVPGDQGGELDPHGADGNGNPVGAVVLTKAFKGELEQVHEWHQFISATEFCIRICRNSDPDNWKWCNHIYDTEGCWWNDPGNYDLGFDTCAADTVVSPPGEYILKNGTTSTFYHVQKTTPTAHPPAKSSSCKVQATVKPGKYPPKKMTTVEVRKASAPTKRAGIVEPNPHKKH